MITIYIRYHGEDKIIASYTAIDCHQCEQWALEIWDAKDYEWSYAGPHTRFCGVLL